MGLREKLVLAVLDAIEDDDPFVLIGVGTDELRITWRDNE